ncbi:MAG: lysylphosphatidylglycerol synthase transmembrane domain-containing protein [Bacilli bacterium]|nr:lysylphosphatidylglycerol synthase transmembrane domain-containing protein [Bacilli bacterium]
MKTKDIINYLILIIITGLVLYFSLKDDCFTIINNILNMNVLYLILAFIFYLLFLFCKSVGTWIIAKTFNKNYKLKSSFRMAIETTFFHAITPFATGGQPYEIYRLNKDKLSGMDSANVSIQNFILYQLALVALGIFAIAYNHFTGLFADNEVLKKLVIVGFLVNFLVIVGLFILTYTKALKKYIIKFLVGLLQKIKIMKKHNESDIRMHKYLIEFDKGAKLLLQNKRKFILLFLVQLLGLIFYYITPLFVILAANINNVNAIESIVVSAYIMIIGAFVPIPGGTGGIEYGFIAFYGNFIKGGSLNAIMLVWRFLTYYLSMIIGMTVLSFRKKD